MFYQQIHQDYQTPGNKETSEIKTETDQSTYQNLINRATGLISAAMIFPAVQTFAQTTPTEKVTNTAATHLVINTTAQPETMTIFDIQRILKDTNNADLKKILDETHRMISEETTKIQNKVPFLSEGWLKENLLHKMENAMVADSILIEQKKAQGAQSLHPSRNPAISGVDTYEKQENDIHKKMNSFLRITKHQQYLENMLTGLQSWDPTKNPFPYTAQQRSQFKTIMNITDPRFSTGLKYYEKYLETIQKLQHFSFSIETKEIAGGFELVKITTTVPGGDPNGALPSPKETFELKLKKKK